MSRRAAELLLRLFARLVPSRDRPAWLQEWQAELAHQPEIRMRPVLGSFFDAAWLRRQFTRDADLIHDAVHSGRMLVRAPGFTAITLLMFAIGIGASTAIVSLGDALFMRRVPIPDVDRVMTVWEHNLATGANRQDVAPGNAIDWLTRARSFEALASAEPSGVNSTIDGGRTEYLAAARVSDRFFDVLRVPMLHGRAFLPQEYQRGAGRVAILSYPLWRDRFGSDRSIVGTARRLDNGEAFTVVGVMPSGFELRLFDSRFQQQREPLVWLPKQGFEEFERTLRGEGYWNVLGRLRAGISVDEARAEFDALSAQLAREYPRGNASVIAQMVPLRAHLVGSLRDVVPLLFGAAALLLIVACANIANLLLARGVGRGREFAVRQALGAGRGRLIRQMLAESLLLATAGGAVGLAVTRWTLDVIARLRPFDVALVDQIPIDIRAGVIVCGVTFIAAMIAGLAPSIQLSRPATASALKEGRGSARRGARPALIIVEVAAALVLAVGAGLLVRSFILIRAVDPGFTSDDVAAIQIFASPRIDTPQKRIVFFQHALDRLRALPGVVAAGGVSAMPFGEAKVIARAPLTITGRPSPSAEQSLVYTTTVAGDYFRAMGIRLLEGRYLDSTDTATSRQVVVVSQAAARRFWPDADPLGSRVQFRFNAVNYDAEVVGLVGDVQHESLDRQAPVELFLPYSQSGFRALTLVVRTAPGSPTTLDALREQIWALDPLQSIFQTSRLDHLVSNTLVGRRFSLFLLAGFAFATVLLAAAGVYGVMSFSTSQRRREFGIRRALGAAHGDIMRMVLREGLKLTGAGVIVGLVVALPAARLLRTLLFGVTAADPMTFLIVALGLMVVTAAACYGPARRATRDDPRIALRAE